MADSQKICDVSLGNGSVFELPTPHSSPTTAPAVSEGEDEDDDGVGVITHDLDTAPLFTRDAYLHSDFKGRPTQYGVLGQLLTVNNKGSSHKPDDNRLYINTNSPFSALVCGVQGAGKSHTVSVILENMFYPAFAPIGTLQKPLSGLVLHYGDSGPSAHACEAASSSLQRMSTLYGGLGDSVTVLPLLLTEDELDAKGLLSMMAVGSSAGAPLYMQIVLSILRDLGESFTFQRFQRELDLKKTQFNPAQVAGLQQRMSLLKSFMVPTGSKGVREQRGRFAAGQLTIVDLSDPFVDTDSACSLFEIVVRLFVRAKVDTGKVVLVDEAHKYLSSNKASGLTQELSILVREQRHLGMRVLISTQEPTVVPPTLLQLCTVKILHRFSAPAWLDHLNKHVSADFSQGDPFDVIVNLKTGLETRRYADDEPPKLQKFGRGYLIVKTRRRITRDGGASVLIL
ncbi:hypothetical protein FISHEDRAFT_63890 [Fistulina hepatica ATCC 64428]|uniref:Uncharacterized protein n=1 Tax=Fistulina hepatica ATCC 64428 TaxID=1128425 RepID=A0A0D7AKG5_9AGAR|nr:hypothetical protein FISHEDRAFT_63890 [Fistulina hepatica ATCC 64428]